MKEQEQEQEWEQEQEQDLDAPFLWTLAALGLTGAGPLTVLGSVVLLAAVPGVAALLLLLPGRDIELATELREAPELDLGVGEGEGNGKEGGAEGR